MSPHRIWRWWRASSSRRSGSREHRARLSSRTPNGIDHGEYKAIILLRQQSESDDDQVCNKFFGDMMQTVRVQSVTEECDLSPLIDHSLDA